MLLTSLLAATMVAPSLPSPTPRLVPVGHTVMLTCSVGNESISPCAVTAPKVPVGGTFSLSYTLTNNNIEQDAFGLSVSGTLVASCTPANVTVTANSHTNFTLVCTAGANGGTGTVTLTATGGISTVTSVITVTVNALSVTPDTSIQVAANSTMIQRFTIRNLGSTGTPTNVTVAKSCPVFNCTLMGSGPYTIAGGSSVIDSIQYTTGAIGTHDVVALVATLSAQTTSKDSGLLAVAVPNPLVPTVSITPHNGDTRNPAMCVAACFDVVASYITPSYVSMDVARSATLVYSSARARAMPTVQVDVTDPSVFTAQSFSLRLRQGGAYVNFLNGASGSTELWFNQTSGGAATRLAGQFDATGLATGVFYDTAVVISHWTSGGYSGTTEQTTVALPVLVLNEQSSPFGAGWTLAGLQHLYFSGDSLTLLVTDGAGSITRFTRATNPGTATAVAADFSTIANVGTGFARTYRNGTVAAFNATGYLTSVADRFADTTKYAYDGSNHVQTITDPAGKTLTFAYSAGKLTSITDPNSRVSSFSVNASGDLALITDPTSANTFQGAYDSHHLLTQQTDRAGNTWKYVYDFASKRASDSTPIVTVDMTATGTGTLTSQRLGGRVRSLEMGILIDPGGGTGTSGTPAAQVQSGGVRAAVFGMTGDSTRFKVDRYLAPIQIERPSRHDTTFVTRDASARTMATLERAWGKIVRNESATFDGPRLSATSNVLSGASIAYAYDQKYDLLQRVTGSTPTIQNYLNAAKSLVDSSRVGSNPDTTKDSVIVLTHDAKGRITRILDQKKDTSYMFYGSGGFQNLDSTRSGSRRSRFRYDNLGRLVRTLNPQGDSIIVVLDALNRTDTTIAPYGVRTAVSYDSLGRVTQLVDAKGQRYKAHFNALGWADTVTDADTLKAIADRRDIYEFTKTGAVRGHYDRNHKHTTTTFDHLGRDSTITLSDGRVTTSAYDDSAGLWMAVSNGESTDTIKTDSPRLHQWQITRRGVTRYVVLATADANGLLRSRLFTMDTTSTALQTVSYGYDAEWRLDSLGVRVGTGTVQRTFFGYNANGMLISKKLTWGSTPTKIDSAAYSPTATRQTYKVTHSAIGLNSLNENYTLDSLERVTRRTTNAGDTAWTYSYDKLGRLTNYQTLYYSGGETCVPDSFFMDGQHCTPNSGSTTIQNSTYGYDSVYNRTDNSPTLISGNRLTSWQGYTLSYDSAGSLVHKQKAGFDQYLFWNSIGQLDSARTGTDTVRFGYDGFGRRVRKGFAGTSLKYTLKYVYDGDDILTVDSAGTRVRTFSYYPGVDQPHSMITNNGSGTRYYFIQEIGAGSVRALIDSTGNVRSRYRYAPFGTMEDSSELVTNSVRFTGREFDKETQLYYYRARYYDPTISRFVSEDPIGLSGGINQYAYAGGDPVNSNDPRGTSVMDYIPGGCMFRTIADGAMACVAGRHGVTYSAGGESGYAAVVSSTLGNDNTMTGTGYLAVSDTTTTVDPGEERRFKQWVEDTRECITQPRDGPWMWGARKVLWFVTFDLIDNSIALACGVDRAPPK